MSVNRDKLNTIIKKFNLIFKRSRNSIIEDPPIYDKENINKYHKYKDPNGEYGYVVGITSAPTPMKALENTQYLNVVFKDGRYRRCPIREDEKGLYILRFNKKIYLKQEIK